MTRRSGRSHLAVLGSFSHDPGSGLAGVLIFGDESLAIAEHKLRSILANLPGTLTVVMVGFRMFASGAIPHPFGFHI
jgi:hypothetical protein